MSDALRWLLRHDFGVTRGYPGGDWLPCARHEHVLDCVTRGDFHVYRLPHGHAANRMAGRLFECSVEGGKPSEWTQDVCRRWCDAHLDPDHPRDGSGDPLPYGWWRRIGGGFCAKHPIAHSLLEVTLVGNEWFWRPAVGAWSGEHPSYQDAMLAALASVKGTFFTMDELRTALLWDRLCTCGHLRAHHEKHAPGPCCVGEQLCECERFAERGP